VILTLGQAFEMAYQLMQGAPVDGTVTI